MRLYVNLVVYNINKTKCKGFASELWLVLQSKIQGTLPQDSGRRNLQVIAIHLIVS